MVQGRYLTILSQEKLVKSRYAEKLNSIGPTVEDPNLLSIPSASPCVDKLPEVEYSDVYHYLINSSSTVTKEELKAYKSLEGYKYLLAGWVSCVHAYEATPSDGSKIIVTAKVRHSLSISQAQ